MLVDNGVTGDSRVQKAARSAAGAGWEVILLGRSPSGLAESWQLGDAQVQLLPVPATLAKHRHQYRRRWLKAPLAYPPGGLGEHRRQWVRAWRADLSLRGAGRGASSPRLRAEEFAAGLLERWVGFRVAQQTRSPRTLHGPLDRAYTAFWQRVLGDRAWRRLAPGLWDWELAFGPVVDKLAPDLIHANDFRMLGVAARAKIRAAAAGRTVKVVWDAHEFLPGVRPVRHNARWLPAHAAHEREYAPYADAVLTVSDSLAELLRSTHGLSELPTVVLNAPTAQPAPTDADGESVPDLRTLCGVGPAVPLLTYSGAAAEQRGLGTMVEALPQLDGVHVAFVVNKPDSPYVQGLRDRAAELGVADRVHVLPYVAHWQVVPFLAGADAGVIPIHHWPNHEIALITKFFEYSHARLPLVVSDVRTMAATVRSTGQGEVFRAEDVADYVRAVRLVLADPQRYRAVYEQPELLANWTWEAQARVLDDLYSRLLPGAPHRDDDALAAPPAAGPAVPALGRRVS
ncbi:glycosyltransferase family 4 protein [Micromonospora phytophila]|uniref:glycosyltransferase family 4 protein n=1 Tax=Micromonospora phytophila TaxID=709888 RepID=UPI00202E5275|nr:glycosyltransferase family 4 protein [Micromonospora phytophila]MCM0675564.1 glycosyltransferase family 4 protein [Micromonospora phytophila]